MNTKQKIQRLELQVSTLWHIIDDERLWHPSVIREIQRRSRMVGKNPKKLRPAEEVFASLSWH